jgi:hypothetical protein
VEALELVIGRLGVAIDPAEHQRRLAEIEVGEPLDERLVERVALEPGLERATEIGLVEVAQLPRGRATPLETLVRVVDVRLFVGEIRVVLGHRMMCGRQVGQPSRNRPVSGRCTLSAPIASSHARRPPVSRTIRPPRSAERWTSRSWPPPGRPGPAHPGVVHAPGRPQPARVPGGPRRRLDPRRDQAARLAAEITLQPVRRYGVDAAVLYSDIVVPRTRSGSASTWPRAPGRSPMRPFRSSATRSPAAARTDDVAYVTDTVDLLVRELPADVPLLAFAGAPFTVASYLVEGRPAAPTSTPRR